MSKTDESPQCCKSILRPTAYPPGFRPCNRRAKVERDGKHYCRQHDPETSLHRAEKPQVEHDARWEAENQKVERSNAEAAACRGVATEVLREGLLVELIEAAKAGAWRAMGMEVES